VASASNDRSQDTRIGRTLFQLLVPVEMEPFFSGTTEMVIELDNGTAGIPWELLDTNTEGGGDARPWAIRAKLLRKLRTARFRVQVVDAGADSSILVIGEPECDPTRYRRLPGARAEARAVATLLAGLAPLSGGKVTSLISPEDPSECGADARTVMNTLLERDWRIVHIAGHGEPSRKAGEAGGVVLSSGTFLGPNEIASMRVVPELVFVNCCHLAARNTAEVLGRPPDRALFAAGVAEKLIQIGVRCVIAAGWAVDDQAANAFATTFYGALLKGQRFIDAVAHAREVALARGGNTWAAYQCYGDPDWQFRPDGLDAADAQRAPSPMDEFAGVASPSGLRIALETLAVKGRFQGAGPEEQHPKIRYLERRFGDTWGGIGQIAEAFGTAWAEAGQRPNAIRWYRQAIAVENGTASLRAAEQLSNTLARVAAETVDEAVQHSRTRKSAAATLATATREGRALIAEAMALLDKLIALQPTMERESLYGSAYKRLALIEAAAGRPAAEARAIAGMKLHYRNAESIGRAHEGSNVFYPVLNRIAADLALNAGRRGWKGLDADAVSSARRSLAAKVRDDPDFWSVVGQTDLDVYEAVARRDLAGRRRSIESAYEDLRARVGAPRYWSSVYDTARFVLQKYAGRAAGAERKAASAVLDRLESFARAEG
jgi:tetratricopeptide (TPR) repeat protein